MQNMDSSNSGTNPRAPQRYFMSSNGSAASSTFTSHSTLDLLLEKHSSTHKFSSLESSDPSSSAKPRNLMRMLSWSCGVGMIICFFTFTILTILGRPEKQAMIGYAAHDQEGYQIIGKERNSLLNDHPSPIMVTDRRGRSNWTISIPSHLEFPLRRKQYMEICSGSMEMAKRVDELKSHSIHGHVVGHHGYYHVDPNFMDVAEAEEHGLLPIGASGSRDSQHTSRNRKSNKICKKSLTYVLESPNAGLGNTLMGLWLSYGLAKKEGRAFFIDDTNWAYGSYTDYFASPPKPACHPPPRTQILPCPHQASHLLVSSATTKYTFGHTFNEEYEDPYQSGVTRQKPIFDLAREGYDALFRLHPEEEAYIERRKTQLADHNTDNSSSSRRLVVGVHVRHGDRHPWEFKYHKSYIPLETYISTATTSLNLTLNNQTQQQQQEQKITILLASDDPTVYVDLQNLYPATTTIRAQTLTPLPPSSSMWIAKWGFSNKHFQSLLLLLLNNKQNPSNNSSSIEEEANVARRRKTIESLARSYLLDLAILGQTRTQQSVIICAVSSVTCRLLAVMWGWDDAIFDGKWKNVDGDWGWSGLEW